MHGDIDQVVPIDGFLEAKNFFIKMIIKLKQKFSKIVNIEYQLKDQVWACNL